MAAIVEETVRLIQRGTLQMFEVGMSNFRRFREAMQTPNVNSQASPTEVQHFVGYLSLKKMAPSTINLYVCAVSNWHKVKGFPDPCADFLVRKAMKGAARARVCPLIPGSQSHLICSANSLQFCPLFACLCMKQKCSLVSSH